MRTAALTVLAVVAALLLGAAALSRRQGLPPRVGPAVEQVCVDAMQRSAPDRSWVAPHREDRLRGREIATVTLGELPSYDGRLVRVAGVLHAEFEWVALYPSRSAMDDRWLAPWVDLESQSLLGADTSWQTRERQIGDRCVVVEGTYVAGPGGHLGGFNGTIADVLRLDAWSSPHRPLVTVPPPPPTRK